MFKGILIAAVGVLFWLWRTGRLAMWVNAAGGGGRLAGKGGGEPRCGRCGYIVRGISSYTCPECGKDLREVGIVVGRQDVPGWSGIVLMAAAWSVGMYVMGAFVVDAAIRALPQSSRVVYTVRLERPQSHAYHVVTIQGGDVCRMDSGTVVVPKRILTVMSLAGRNSTLDLDVPAGVYAYAGVDGKKVQVNGVFDTKAALDWMKAAGIDTTLPGVEAEAVEIVERAVAVPPPYQGTSHFSTHTTGQSAGFLGIDVNWDGTPVESKGKSAMAGGSLFLIWIGGLWFIVRRYAPRR